MVLSLRYVVHVAYDGLNMSVAENSLLEALLTQCKNHFLVNFLMNIQVRKNSSADSSHVKLKICKVTLFHTFSPHATTTDIHSRNVMITAKIMLMQLRLRRTLRWPTLQSSFCGIFFLHHTSNKALVEGFQYLWGPLIRVQSAWWMGCFFLFFRKQSANYFCTKLKLRLTY